MKKCLFLLLLVPLFGMAPPIRCPRELAPIAEKVFQLPEARALLEQVERDGPISIVVGRHQDFNAFWDGNLRQIIINRPQTRSEGSIIISILMELHNASTDRELGRLARAAVRREISRSAYVEGVERMEHRNALGVCRMIQQGRRIGLFPSTARWSICQRFEDYYDCQRRSGHSQWIASSYDRMS